jgi:hypothetical protein
VVEQLVGERHRLSSWYAAGSSGAQRCKTPERAPRPRPAASAHQARAGRWTAAGHHAPIIKREVADQQHAHHRHQADPSLPPGQPRQVRNCLHADRRDFRSRPASRSRHAPASPNSPTRVRPADGPSGSSPSGRCGRGRLSSSTEIHGPAPSRAADDLACCSFAIRCPYPSGTPLGVRQADRKAGRRACRSRHERSTTWPISSSGRDAAPAQGHAAHAADPRRPGRARFERQSQQDARAAPPRKSVRRLRCSRGWRRAPPLRSERGPGGPADVSHR